MSKRRKLPELIVLLAGREGVEANWEESPRLQRWAAAFDAWLEERGREGKTSTRNHSRLAWRRLFYHQPRLPWELTPADLADHVAWMQAEGYAPATIGYSLGNLTNFFRWCGEREVDPECGPHFNPAASIPQPKVRREAGPALWSPGEIQELLEALRGDPSPMGRRDLAFFLARLQAGAPSHRLLGLRWEQIEAREGGAWVRWRAEAEAVPLPPEAWNAILAWLAVSERLARMQPSSYVFVPLAKPSRYTVPNHAKTQRWAEAWVEDRPLSRVHILNLLKAHGKRAGIPAGKLTLMALKRTAIRQKLDEGVKAADLKSFLASPEEPMKIKFRLKRLPGLPAETPPGASPAAAHPEPPRRERKPLEPGDNSKHGFYAQSQPPELVQEVRDEGRQGLGAEVEGLRRLGRELLKRQAAAGREEALLLDQAYLTAAARLARLIEVGRQLAKGNPKSEWAEGMLKMYDDLAEITGQPSSSESLRRAALSFEPELEIDAPHLAEEIANARCILRRTLARALEAEDTRELLRLAEIYGAECNKLVQMLRVQGAGEDRLVALLEANYEQALTEVMEELNIHI